MKMSRHKSDPPIAQNTQFAYSCYYCLKTVATHDSQTHRIPVNDKPQYEWPFWDGCDIGKEMGAEKVIFTHMNAEAKAWQERVKNEGYKNCRKRGGHFTPTFKPIGYYSKYTNWERMTLTCGCGYTTECAPLDFDPDQAFPIERTDS